jgi:hypothetical protein
MNEKFRLLALEAQMGTADFDAGSYYVATPDRMQKLCELIVRECMACSTWVGNVNKNAIEPVHTAHAINQRIKQNFGVDE